MGANMARPTTQKRSATLRLRDIAFSDIYVSVDCEAFLRGVPGTTTIVPPPPQLAADLIGLHAVLTTSNIQRQDFAIRYDGVLYRCSRIPSQGGQWFALRRGMTRVPTMDELGFASHVSGPLRKLGTSHGLLIVAGATGHGKSTTAACLIGEWLRDLGDVAITVEDPPEAPLDGPHGEMGWCFQVDVENGDFATPMVHAMRWRPRYILLGEVRSSEAAVQALRAGINGHLVVTTIHAGGIEEALLAMLRLAEAKDGELARAILADGLCGVIHQSLVGEPKRPVVNSLIAARGEGCPVRAKIRDGKITMLNTEIRLQASRRLQNVIED